MKDVTERLKHFLRFHEGKVKQFRDDKEAQEFHKGAIMAFSKCQVLLERRCRTDNNDKCICPAGVGICGFGDPDTIKCNYRRR